MFDIDYSRSAETSAVGEKTRQPAAGNMGIDTQLAEQKVHDCENLTPEQEAAMGEGYGFAYDPDEPYPCWGE